MNIQPLDSDSVAAIVHTDGGNGWKNDGGSWSKILEEHKRGARLVLVADEDGTPLGYGSLLWQSAYAPFASAGTPEIHDLVTARSQRGRGIGTQLITAFEQRAADDGHNLIGLGVGLYADYGAAQRLYAKLGYRPDGHGITYRNRPVTPGANLPIDDDLVLWLTKILPP